MVAKNDKAHEALVNQLTAKTVTRKYKALVHGVIPHDHGTIDAPIGRDPKDRQSMCVIDHGKPAVTHFHVLERFHDFTYIECRLETGRTHQIRVHMKYIGYPLAEIRNTGPERPLIWEARLCMPEFLVLHTRPPGSIWSLKPRCLFILRSCWPASEKNIRQIREAPL